MQKKLPLIVSRDKKFIVDTKDFEFAYIRNIFEATNLYQLVVVIKGCHEVEPYKDGIVVSSSENQKDVEEDMKKLIRAVTDSTGLECVEL